MLHHAKKETGRKQDNKTALAARPPMPDWKCTCGTTNYHYKHALTSLQLSIVNLMRHTTPIGQQATAATMDFMTIAMMIFLYTRMLTLLIYTLYTRYRTCL